MHDGGDIDPNQEPIAQGPANILSGLFGGFLVVCSRPRHQRPWLPAPAPSSPIQSPTVCCFLTPVLLTPLFRGMPNPAFAAIVIGAMPHRSQADYLRDLLARSR
jgi:sulfate permease, SulP family